MAVSPLPGPAVVAEAAGSTHGIVMALPRLDQHPGLGEALEDLSVQQLISKRELSPT